MKQKEFLIHSLCWIIIICFPMFFFGQGENFGVVWPRYVRAVGGPLSYMIVFYANYLWLVPKYLLSSDKRKFRDFFVANLLLIVVAVMVNSLWWNAINQFLPPTHQPPFKRSRVPMFFHAGLMQLLIVALSVALRMGQRWQLVEQHKKEAEQANMETELKNLRTQLNPHFVLNTLNNIYSLIAFDTERAQKAVEELSHLLRHVLYDNNNSELVPLHKEVEFIRDYIELMKIRCTDNVRVDINIHVADDDSTPIAPLLFISLVENAFKHGISPTKPSFITVAIKNTDGVVVCDIVNSNFPKTEDDKSGSGIGMEQVQRLLTLRYPNKFSWTHGPSYDGATYRSTIRIHV